MPELEPCVACEEGADADFPCLTACVPYIHCVGKGCANKKAAACDVLKSVPVSTDARKVSKAEKACGKDSKGAACVKECMPGIQCVIDHFAGAEAMSGCAAWVGACKDTFEPQTAVVITTTAKPATAVITTAKPTTTVTTTAKPTTTTTTRVSQTDKCPSDNVEKCSSTDPVKCPPACLDDNGEGKADVGFLKACMQWLKCFGNF